MKLASLIVLSAALLFSLPVLAQDTGGEMEPDPADTLPPPTGSVPPPAPAPAPPPPPPAAPVESSAPAPLSGDSPVVRAEAGNMGMYFRFGGLATLVHTNNARNVGPLVFNQVGLKFVASEALHFPVYFGTGFRLDKREDDGNPLTDETSGNWGIDLGGGIEYHFRIWRRISPFIGGALGFSVEDPSGDDNVRFGVGLGPVAGVEYYIADRLSLTAMYMFVIEVAHQDAPGTAVTTFALRTLAGGALNITYYF